MMDMVIKERTPSEKLALLQCQNVELKDTFMKKKEHLVALRKEKKVVANKIQEFREVALGYDVVLQVKAVDRQVEKTEKQWEVVAEKRAVVKKLEEEIAQLKEKREQKLKIVEKMSFYHDFLEKVVKMTEFEDVQGLLNHLEDLFYSQEKLCKTESIQLEDIDIKRNELLSLEDKHKVDMVNKNTLQSQLHVELKHCQSEACIWEKKWDEIQNKAAKKTLMLVQIKMGTVNLYEKTGGTVGEDGINISDTDSQLDEVASLIKDLDNTVKQFQMYLKKEKEKNYKKKQDALQCFFRSDESATGERAACSKHLCDREEFCSVKAWCPELQL